jgi:hypothetical protein
VIQFKCNGCKRNTDYIEIEWKNKPKGFAIYQCKDCGCVGVKNEAEPMKQSDNTVSRCNSCGSWQFSGLECHTCLLIGEYDANL